MGLGSVLNEKWALWEASRVLYSDCVMGEMALTCDVGIFAVDSGQRRLAERGIVDICTACGRDGWSEGTGAGKGEIGRAHV